ncbi:conserved hypothetical protein [Vibrio nigripulchritudo SOn1]|uniref:DUF4238 domain-containing protein n=1 Tax=Vibrio nigripulchritudo SOn1 TaxID=1238450 RepID=A0AAV2VNQ9_9VIBR|nr:DUF4238 domain-containing protein [Vibrio nigripulchritudo]CCO46336.1 conserved hypothetical protein [Vibrio nigripulchritudo SOn1]
MNISVPKHLQIKKEHHYVWANYLRNWSNGKKIWFVTAKGKVIHESTKLVAKERYFYKVKRLTKEHVDCIQAIASLSPPETEQVHRLLLEELLTLQQLEDELDINPEASCEYKQTLRAAKENWLENRYSFHEEMAKSAISKLAKGRLSALNDQKNHMNFCRFLGHQFARTKSFRTRAEVITNRMPEKLKGQKYMAKISNECRWFSSYIIGENFGASIYQARHYDSYCMLVNNTEEPFITSDQPVINVHDSVTDEIKQVSPEECDLYYPLSSKFALVISSSHTFPQGTMKVELAVVQKLNTKVAKNSHTHIFCSQEAVVKKYVKFVGHKDCQIQTQEFPDFN